MKEQHNAKERVKEKDERKSDTERERKKKREREREREKGRMNRVLSFTSIKWAHGGVLVKRGHISPMWRQSCKHAVR